MRAEGVMEEVADDNAALHHRLSATEAAAYADGRRWGARPFGQVRVCPYPFTECDLRFAWLDGFHDAREGEGRRRPDHRPRVLVVEDVYFLAEEMSELVHTAGLEVEGPFPTVAAALEVAMGPEALVGAILDVDLRGETVWPVADALIGRGVPIVLATGYEVHQTPPPYAHLPRWVKPIPLTEAETTLARWARGGVGPADAQSIQRPVRDMDTV